MLALPGSVTSQARSPMQRYGLVTTPHTTSLPPLPPVPGVRAEPLWPLPRNHSPVQPVGYATSLAHTVPSVRGSIPACARGAVAADNRPTALSVGIWHLSGRKFPQGTAPAASDTSRCLIELDAHQDAKHFYQTPISFHLPLCPHSYPTPTQAFLHTPGSDPA